MRVINLSRGMNTIRDFHFCLRYVQNAAFLFVHVFHYSLLETLSFMAVCVYMFFAIAVHGSIMG